MVFLGLMAFTIATRVPGYAAWGGGGCTGQQDLWVHGLCQHAQHNKHQHKCMWWQVHKCQGIASISCARNLECVALSPPPLVSVSGFLHPSLCPGKLMSVGSMDWGKDYFGTSIWFQSMTVPQSTSEAAEFLSKSHSSYSVPPWLLLASITTSALALSLEVAWLPLVACLKGASLPLIGFFAHSFI